MKKITFLAMSVLLIVMTVACAGVEEETSPSVPATPPTTPAPAPPKSGDWTTSTGFGELVFTVNLDSTGIAKISYHFTEFNCDGAEVSGGVAVENPSLWPITDGQFTADTYVRPWNIIIEGRFDETGTHASGTWEITGTTCSGTWESSRAG